MPVFVFRYLVSILDSDRRHLTPTTQSLSHMRTVPYPPYPLGNGNSDMASDRGTLSVALKRLAARGLKPCNSCPYSMYVIVVMERHPKR